MEHPSTAPQTRYSQLIALESVSTKVYPAINVYVRVAAKRNSWVKLSNQRKQLSR